MKKPNRALPVLTVADGAPSLLAAHQPSAHFRRRPSRGFTLVECALALAIIAIAFVPIMGLLPMGLNTSREAINYSIGSNIAQMLFNEAQQTDFNILTASSDTERPVRFFDVQGAEVKIAGSPSIIYHAKTRVIASTAYPGDQDAGKSNTSVATITIQVASNASNRTLVTDPATELWARTNRQSILTFSFYVSRTQ